MSGGDRRIAVLAMVAIGMIAMREFREPSGVLTDLPAPHAFAGALVVYGMAALLSEVNAPFAVALAAGWTLYLVYDQVEGGGKIARLGERNMTDA